MIETTRTWVRKSLNSPWWTVAQTNELLQYIKDKYSISGKRISSILTLDKSGLILTNTAKFVNLAAFEEYSSDPVIKAWARTRNAHCIKHKIDETEPIIFNND